MAFALALGAAIAAALCYGTGAVLQQVGARRVAPVTALKAASAMALARQSWFAAGVALDLVGWGLSLVALRILPLFLVETVAAGSVVVAEALSILLLGAKTSGLRVAACLLAVGGLVPLAASAAPGPAVILSAPSRAVLTWGPLAALGPAAVVRRWRSPLPAAVLAGVAFAGASVVGRAWTLDHGLRSYEGLVMLTALAAYGLTGTFMHATALRRWSATAVTAVVLTVTSILPAVVGWLVLGDHFRPGRASLAAAGFVLSLGGILALAGDRPASVPLSTT